MLNVFYDVCICLDISPLQLTPTPLLSSPVQPIERSEVVITENPPGGDTGTLGRGWRSREQRGVRVGGAGLGRRWQLVRRSSHLSTMITRKKDKMVSGATYM